MRSLIGLVAFCLALSPLLAADDYKLGPDSMEQPGVPKGKVTQMPKWKSKVFDGTERDWWIYVPAQYDASKPAAVIDRKSVV